MKIKHLQPEVSDASEVLHLKLWDGSVFDYSLSGNSGTAQNQASPAYPGYIFDGTTDYITLTTAFDYTTESFTISMWVVHDIDGEDVLLWQGDTDSGYYIVNKATTKKIQVRTRAADGEDVTTSTSIVPIGKWTHVGITRSGTSVNVYINGAVSALDAAGSHSTIVASENVASLGGYGVAGSFAWQGKMSDVRINNEARTASQIKDLYEQTRWRYSV